ncbi:MAG: histidinol-phosphate transaminase [Rickettsiales bacterium]|nr:histidinol-phosphate transaminase [Rickettsiales bacterium]
MTPAQLPSQPQPQNSAPAPKPGILGIAPYVGGKSKAKEGVKVVKLSSNETPLGPSPKALKAFEEHARYLHRYPDGSAALLREAIGKIYNIPTEQLVCGNGSDELIGLLVHAYAGTGDEVLISEHGFLMYQIYAQSFGAVTVKAPEKNLRTDVDALLARVTEKTKIVFVANPNNPTGSYITREEMARLHAGLPPHVILAIDGAYAEYPTVEDYTSGTELALRAQNVVALRTFSKIYGLSSLRLGWMVAPPAIIDVVNRIRSPFNVNGAALAAGVAAIEDTAFVQHTREFNNTQLAWLSAELTKLGLTVHPSIANFLLVRFPGGSHSSAAANMFMMERGLIPREVANYGLPEHLRISIGLEEDNRAVVETLREFLKA